MSDPTSSAIPPLLPTVAPPLAAPRKLGEEPGDSEPIRGVLGAVEALLRHPRRVVYRLHQADGGSLIPALLLIAGACSLLYGMVVGSFSMEKQLWAAPVKITCGLLLSAAICLPSLYIFSCLSGARASLREVGGLIAGLLALMTVLLVSFAPVAWVFSQSTESLAAMGALHLVFWLVAVYFGVRFLQTGFAHLGSKPAGLRVWILIFMLVMLQMSAALRPLVGTSDTFLPKEKKFFVSHWLQELHK
jgi:hypothetical protein